jgi:3D (Asp-Asp-Asp) domain-containing protein
MKTIILAILFIPNVLGKGYVFRKVNPIIYDLVTATTYSNNPKETDSTPLITASGFKLDSLNPAKHRVIAISRDLKVKYKFGSKVRILNAGSYNGIYFVQDLMNKRWKSKIDILINSNDKPTKLHNVKMIKI